MLLQTMYTFQACIRYHNHRDYQNHHVLNHRRLTAIVLRLFTHLAPRY